MELEALRARRESRRREIRRRRLGAAGVLAAAALAVVAIVIANGSGRPTSKAPATGTAAGRAGTATGAAGTGTRAPGGSAAREDAPILMYHVIAAPPTGAPFPGLYVAPAEFAAQMRALKDAGWHAVTLDELQANWRSGRPLGPGKPIVLTFDNGYHSQYSQALPVLQQLGWVADENIQLTGLPPSQGGLSEGEVRALLAAGWELDSQGFSHADLNTLGAEQLRYQVAGARSALQNRYHVPVNWFCYPSGHYNPTVVAAVKADGYAGSTTVIPGWAGAPDDPYRLHRLRVLGGTSPQELLALVASSRGAGAAPASYPGG